MVSLLFKGNSSTKKQVTYFFLVYWKNTNDTLLFVSGSGVSDFRPVSNLDLQFSMLPNGSLSIAPAAHHHEGQYMCRAENGIGRGLSKIIAVSVNGR